MHRRIKEVLINPSEEEMLAREPLMAFSFYLSGRNNVLLSIADEIIENLDKGFSSNLIHFGLIERAETLMWLWTLGAYEVVRTMCQAKECFSENFYTKISQLKRDLSKVRMPASKMEKQGKKKPVNSNRSPCGLNIAKRDLLIGDPDDKDVSARMLLENYEKIVSSLTVQDILKHHRESYND